MNPYHLDIAGDWYADPAVLDKFSRDMSAYRIVPALVVAPKNEEDILSTLRFARNEGLGIVSRAGGSDLSGASIGPGIILNLKKYLHNAVRLGEVSIVEPGMILDHFVKKISAHNLMLPAIPSSSAWCALGGNIGTRATGPRTAKYGTLDAFVTSLRFITAGGGSSRYGSVPARSPGDRTAANPEKIFRRCSQSRCRRSKTFYRRRV